MKQSSTKTEQKAITVLRNLLDSIDCVSHSIGEGNTYISWDGDIKLFKNANIDDKGNLSSIIRVQVKGRTQKLPNNDKVSYWIEKKDLENYLLENGTIFFVVIFNKKNEYKIFYIDLLPYNIRKYLTQECNGKQEIKVKLKELLNDSFELEKVLRNFEINKKQQEKISEKVFSQEDISFCSDGKKSKLKFYSWGSLTDSVSSLLGKETYIYELDENDNVINMNLITFSMISEPFNINIKDKQGDIYYSRIDCEYTQDKEIIHIGKSLRIYKNDGKFNIKLRGTLKERINTLKFLEVANEENGFFINETWHELQNGIEKIEIFAKEKIIYNKIYEFLQKHNIDKDLELDNWEWTDINKFIVWIRAIDDGIPIKVSNFETSVIGSIRIRDICFSIFAERKEDGRIFVKSIWNSDVREKYMFMRGNPNDENNFESTNIFDFLNKQAYLSDDINYEEMKEYFNNNELKENEEICINLQSLEAILAYDECKKKELLEYADFLLDKIKHIESISDIAFINICQIKKRLDTLCLDDKFKLMKIKELNQGDFYEISIDLILDKKDEALRKIELLPPFEKEEYLKFPISRYLN